MPKNNAKNITDRIALLLPIASTRLLGTMLMKASIPDGCSAPVLTISPARPAECCEHLGGGGAVDARARLQQVYDGQADRDGDGRDDTV